MYSLLCFVVTSILFVSLGPVRILKILFFSGAYGHLGSLVHTNPMVQEHLGPSLLSTYIAVDQIEGLDVDKEEFDKYGARLVGGVGCAAGLQVGYNPLCVLVGLKLQDYWSSSGEELIVKNQF